LALPPLAPSNGQYTSIDPPAGVDPIAFSINNSGQIVGYYSDNITNQAFSPHSQKNEMTATGKSRSQTKTKREFAGHLMPLIGQVDPSTI
jgi:hypothetical protein